MAFFTLPKRPLLSIQIAALFTAILATSPLVHAQSLAQGAGSNVSTIRIGGSSTVFPFMKEAIRAFREAGNSAKIEIKETGTSEGFRRFCTGQLEIANASRPINTNELKACSSNRINFIELPIAFDALTIVVHPSNSWVKQISLKELARLWRQQAEGKIDRWNEVNLDWPDLPIQLCSLAKTRVPMNISTKLLMVALMFRGKTTPPVKMIVSLTNALPRILVLLAILPLATTRPIKIC